MPGSWVPVSAHLDSATEKYEVLRFLKEECANYPILTQEVVTGDNEEYWANVMQLELASSISCVKCWTRQLPPVAATPAQPRKFKLLRQNLTVPRRARLKLVHSSRLIQRNSLASWWKKVKHCTQSCKHVMMQTIDYRFESRQ